MKSELLYYFEGLDKSVLNLNPYLHDFKFLMYDLTKKEDFNKFNNKFKEFIIETNKKTLPSNSNFSVEDLKSESSEILNEDESDREKKERLNELIRKLK